MRTWRKALVAVAAMSLLVSGASAGKIADYRDDFKADAPLTAGWEYLWNAPTGWTPAPGVTGDETTGNINDRSSYQALADAGSQWTADGNGSGTDHQPDGYVRLSGGGGHPGMGISQRGPATHDRYAIAAYTIQPGDLPASPDGVVLGFITDSFVDPSNPGRSASQTLEARVALNDTLALSKTWAGQSARDIDTEIGPLHVGDTVYVAVGPDSHPGSDGFNWDFTVQAVPRIVARYRGDFQGTAMPDGWQYLWNAPSDWDGSESTDGSDGAIGSVADYELLSWSGSKWSPDGDGNNSNGKPGNYLGLTSTGGHPGRGSSQSEGIGNSQARYAIAAFTVPVSASYGIVNSSYSTVTSAGNGNDVLVHVNGNDPLLNVVIPASVGTGSFDVTLGWLEAGDTVYVATGPRDHDGNDSFTWDFQIAIIPEPATLSLLGLGALALIRRRRR